MNLDDHTIEVAEVTVDEVKSFVVDQWRIGSAMITLEDHDHGDGVACERDKSPVMFSIEFKMLDGSVNTIFLSKPQLVEIIPEFLGFVLNQLTAEKESDEERER